MAEQLYARLLAHGKTQNYATAKGERFTKPPTAQDLVTCWRPVDADTEKELRQQRSGGGPGAAMMFEFLEKPALELQIATSEKANGSRVEGIDLSSGSQALKIAELEKRLHEANASQLAQAQQHTSQLNNITAMMEKLMAQGTPAMPSIGAGASGDIADPNTAAEQRAPVDATPNAAPRRGGKPARNDATDARPADAPKAFVPGGASHAGE